MTIEARRATDSGAAAQQRLLHLEPARQVRGGGGGGRDQAPEVDDPPHAGRGGRLREALGRPARSRSAKDASVASTTVSIEWMRK